MKEGMEASLKVDKKPTLRRTGISRADIYGTSSGDDYACGYVLRRGELILCIVVGHEGNVKMPDASL